MDSCEFSCAVASERVKELLCAFWALVISSLADELLLDDGEFVYSMCFIVLGFLFLPLFLREFL